MTKTNATAKVSYVKPDAFEKPKASNEAKAQAATDVYKSSDADAYKSLIGGNVKAESFEGGVLEEMFDAASNVPQQRQGYYDRMQDFLGTMMVGDARWKAPQDTVGDIPYVPDLHKDILKYDVEKAKMMEPVVERYSALKKVLSDMIDVATASLHSRNMSKMTASEYRSMEAYRRKLKLTLRECNIQMERAEEYLEKQKAKENAGIW